MDTSTEVRSAGTEANTFDQPRHLRSATSCRLADALLHLAFAMAQIQVQRMATCLTECQNILKVVTKHGCSTAQNAETPFTKCAALRRSGIHSRIRAGRVNALAQHKLRGQHVSGFGTAHACMPNRTACRHYTTNMSHCRLKSGSPFYIRYTPESSACVTDRLSTIRNL